VSLRRGDDGFQRDRGTIVALIAFLALAYGCIGAVDSYEATDPGEVCVVNQGGPFDGTDATAPRAGGAG
jgi:hypothetical protein